MPLAWTGLVYGQSPPADKAEPVEQQVKAAYIYNFGSFIDWPVQAFVAPDSPLQIGVMESDALADQLVRTVAGRKVHGRPLAVRKLRRTDPIDGLQLLFVGRVSKPQLAEILAAGKRHPMLLVTEAEGALGQGSMINFVVADERLRFEVALRTAEQSGLSISARLLAAALKVENRTP